LRYYDDYIENNQSTLLAKLYSVYQIQMQGIKPLSFLVMENTVNCKSKPFKFFDLKGSMINRYVKRGENQTLKDRNFLWMKANLRMQKK
jgi:hypothetical protein